MDSKQGPPPPYEAMGAEPPQVGSQNTGYSPGPGEQIGGQGGYPQGYRGYSQGYGGQPPPQTSYYHHPQQAGYPPTQAGGYSYNQSVVVTQPTRQGMIVTNVPDHMGLAIFVTLCCCWPLGLVAIMRAQESRRAVERGDYPAATTYSQEARRYSMWAVAGGCISLALVIVIVVVYVTTITSSYT